MIDDYDFAPADFQRLLDQLRRHAELEEDDPPALLAREFCANTYCECCETLLTRTNRLRVWPELSPAPLVFRFEMDVAFKRKLGRDSPVEWMPGPVTGEVIYRGDMFTNPEGPCLAVLIDRQLGYFHPNYSRRDGILCIGDLNNLPPGPVPLGPLLENHIFPIVSYQNRRPAHPLDIEAAHYFAFDPTAMLGLEPVEPLY